MPRATPTPQSEAEDRREWWWLAAWPVACVVLVVTGALMLELGLNTAGKAVLIAAAAPLVVFALLVSDYW